jgi:hypothetical protein
LTLEYKTPLSWNKLASDISEVVWEIKSSFENNWNLSVIIKNPKEEGTLNLTKKIARHITRITNIPINILGMYPYEQILLSHSTSMIKKRMYDIIEKPTIKNIKSLKCHYLK